MAALVVGVLTLWVTSPNWLPDPRLMTVAGLLVSITGLIVPFLVRRLDRHSTFSEQRRARDRKVMLARVRYRWITGVLEQSLANQVRIGLELTRREDAVWQRDMMLRQPEHPGVRSLADIPISAVFNELGGGLLILGAPGSGKTTALLELARDLLDGAEADSAQPIPAIFNLTSWSGHRQTLAQWLIEELHSRYSVPRPIAQRWLATGELLPLLDGLDEVATAYRDDCVHAINAFGNEYGLVRIIVCSRTEEYMLLVNRLRVEAAVELQPPTHQQVYDYLAAAGDALTDVQIALQADPTLWQLFASPLVLNIAALTYQDRPAEALRATGNAEQRLALLFAAYFDRMSARRPGRYSSVHTRAWLAWLAHSMRARNQSEFQIDRLTPDWLLTTTQQRLATLSPAISIGLFVGLVDVFRGGLLIRGLVDGLIGWFFFALVFGLNKTDSAEAGWSWQRVRTGMPVGLVVGLVGGLIACLAYGLRIGLAYGIFFGLFAWLLFALRTTAPAEEVSWSWRLACVGLLFGLFAGLIAGLTYGLHVGLPEGLVFGLAFTLAFGLLYGLVPGLVHERAEPNEGIHRSARHALVIGLVFGVVFGVVFGMFFGVSQALFHVLFFGVSGGLVFGGLTCLQHFGIRLLLASGGFAPLRYVRFLDEATDQLFLSRAGGGYIFVHRLLLEYFANLDNSFQFQRAGEGHHRRMKKSRVLRE